MKNKIPIAICTSYALISFTPGCKKEPLPNIVYILADDLGYGDVLALNEHSKIQTTNIDRLAQEGVVFTNAHSSSAVCTPTRYGILTGRYNWRSILKKGVLDGYSKALIPPDRKTMAGMLKDQGYQTACIGKWHLGWDWNKISKGEDSIDYSKPISNGPTTLGFDYFYGFSGSLDMPPYVYVENDMPISVPNRLTEGNNIPVGSVGWNGAFWRKGPTGSDFDHRDCLSNLTWRAGKYITESVKSKKPYFLYFPMPAPHTPILPSKEFQGKSGLNAYADYVMMVDFEVGEILNAIDQSGEKENTIVVFNSDNGCSPWADFETLKGKGHNPSYIYRGYKADLFDGGHRIPCMVRWPAKVKPHKVGQTICLTDFLATFSAITGYRLKDNEGEDSFNLLPLLLNIRPQKYSREATVHHSINGNFTIRKGEWKLLLSPSSGGWSYPQPGKDDEVIATLPPYQLYNMKSDPGETKNLCNEYPAIINELKALMIKYIKDGRSTPGTPQKNDGEKILL